MKITSLGQNGFLFDTGKTKLMTDRYLSDSVGRSDPSRHRRVPVDESVFGIRPDILFFTHAHIDHYDPESAERFLRAYDGITVLCPESVWREVRKFGGSHNYVEVSPGVEWSEGDLRVVTTPAVHSDPFAVGALIYHGGRTFYVTGDTLYSRKVTSAVPRGIDAVFLPINGRGNNMNPADAERFAAAVGAKTVFPCHYGIYDDLEGSGFDMSGTVKLRPFETVEIWK